MDSIPVSVVQREQIKRAVIERAGNRCEGSPKFPSCRAKDGQAHPETDKHVSLSVIRLVLDEPGATVAAQIGNRRAWCERCVLSYDFPAHATHNWRSRRKAALNGELFPIDEPGKGR